MNIKKYRDTGIHFCLNFLMILGFWGGMLRKSYNADTVFHMIVEDADVHTRIAHGRYITALLDFLLLKAGIRTTTNLSITVLLSFVLFAFALIIMQNLFAKWSPENPWHRAGYICGINLVFLNVLFAENLMFGEFCVYFALSYLLAAIAVWFYSQNNLFAMILTLITAVCTYQNAAVFASILVAFYICFASDGILSGQTVKKEILGIGICMGSGGLNLLSGIVLQKTGVIRSFERNAAVGYLSQKISKMLESLISLHQNSLHIFPNVWFPLLFSATLVVLLVYSCIREQRIGIILYILLVLTGSLLLLFVMPLIMTDFFFPPRMAFCFYLIQSLLAISVYRFGRFEIKSILSLGCAIYLTIQLLFSNFIVTNHFISNTLDEVYVQLVYQEVLKYEKETGNQVTKLAIEKDSYAPDYYDEITYTSGQINERVLGTSTLSLITMVTGRYFEEIPMDKEMYDRNFAEKDWDHLDLDEQLIFEGDTLYWCLF